MSEENGRGYPDLDGRELSADERYLLELTMRRGQTLIDLVLAMRVREEFDQEKVEEGATAIALGLASLIDSIVGPVKTKAL